MIDNEMLATTFNCSTLKVTIIILNWNGKIDTLECLESVNKLNHKNIEIIIVDNCSTDDSVQFIKDKYPRTMILKNNSNLGFSGGNNVGIDYALRTNTYSILLLNNDTIVNPDLLDKLLQASNALSDDCIFGPKIYFFNDPTRIWFAGGKWVANKLKFIHIGSNQLDGPEYSNCCETDYITGCALFAKAEIFKSVGLLDDDFFLTYEETDWCYRAKSKGYKCYFVPEAKLWHKVSVSFGGNQSPLRNYFMTRNKMLWGRKHLNFSLRLRLHSEAINTIFSILIPRFIFRKGNAMTIKNIYWALSTWLNAVKRHLSSPNNIAILQGYLDYYLGRFGDCPPKIRLLSNSTSE